MFYPYVASCSVKGCIEGLEEAFCLLYLLEKDPTLDPLAYKARELVGELLGKMLDREEDEIIS